MDEQTRTPYIAILVYVTHVEGNYARPRYSEDVVLLYRNSIEDARTAAEAKGRGDEISYHNEYGESVTWSFIGLADVRNALYDSLEESTTLYSRSFLDLAQYKDIFSLSSLESEQES
ncbi:DUF4288 domain-containing protein [Nonomuraea sp. K274]|uniref:DUF4288 domain-containing protein n=1 Tax=Nonomuraea cypriaca TaxID=1187855 RepID=A0A931ANX6_9ACTN|nr:DUF4288 domain-containing protein [Nonomuraea cypriaca]MBF8193735.1 DUF4288 domain-containing protein [Nonomuraea cypriaca]